MTCLLVLVRSPALAGIAAGLRRPSKPAKYVPVGTDWSPPQTDAGTNLCTARPWLGTYLKSRQNALLPFVGNHQTPFSPPPARHCRYETCCRQGLKLRPQFAIEGDPALFVSKQKRRISTRHVHERMKDWGLKQGISTPVHPHKLRHSFASHMLESSGDLRAVQEMLGHSSLSATQVYTHVDFQHLAKVYDKAHPRAKKSKYTLEIFASQII